MTQESEQFVKVDSIATMLAATSEERATLEQSLVMPKLSYDVCDSIREHEITAEIDAELREKDFRVSGENCSAVWEKGWSEVLEQLKNEPSSVESVIAPQYFGKYKEIRFQGHYVEPFQKDFEYQLDNVIREATFRLFLAGSEPIVEIGCGTANSLLKLRKLYPDRKLIGLDWAHASGNIINELNRLDYDLVFKRFNMLDLTGAENLNLDGVTVLSVHALEQLGSNIEALLSYFLASKAKRFVHIEPIVELYDTDAYFDNVASQYHQKRNYLSGFLERLETLEKDGEITLERVCRMGFGNRYHEAYSLIIWSVKSE